MEPASPGRLARLLAAASRRDLVLGAVPLALVLALLAWAVLHWVRPAPPKTITISSGPDGSSFQRSAERYRAAMEKSGVTVRLVPSHGSLENLRRLSGPASDVDVGFVQVGVKLPDPAPGEARRELASLGTIGRQPLWVIVRGEPPDRLFDLNGKRLVVGPEGSGTRVLASTLLKASGVEAGNGTEFVDLDDDAVGEALQKGQVDAAFLMGDSASPKVIRGLVGHPALHAVQLSQLDAIVRRYPYLDRIVIPMGALELSTNLPASDLALAASSVELVARADLHPAISDLLLETLREVHGRAGLLAKAGEFPAAREHELPLSDDARRYYQSGKRWLYKVLPFWAASLADRFLWALVPLVLLLVPAFRLLPTIYRWRIRLRLLRIYGALLELERDVRASGGEDGAALAGRLDALEARADALKLPVAFADQFYVLREHIGFVRRRLAARAG
ncbi:MAG: TAXI family TRAP transporter solute-binding subunit [Anaeromyxobacter sp.]